MIGASFAACAIKVGARPETNAAFAWLSARHITSLSLDFNNTWTVGCCHRVRAFHIWIAVAQSIAAVHMVSSDDVSRYLVDGWIMVSAQCRTHIADRQAAGAFPLIPFERFHKWNVVPTGSHVRGESV